MEQTNIVVTGGCGFLGTEIVSALLKTKRFAITAIDISPPALGSNTFPTEVRYVRANILDQEALQKVFEEARPAIVIHTVGMYPLGAARYSMWGKDVVHQVNVEGTRNVLRAAKESGAKGLVYTSSVTVVLDELNKDFKNVDESWPTGKADTSYGMSKAIAEELVLSANTHDFVTCALRSAPIFGPHDPACIPIIYSSIAAGQTPFILGTGTNLQDFVYVTNVADAHVLATANLLNSQTAAGEAMFITNGEPISLRDMCMAVWKEFGHVPRFQVVIPEGLAWWMGYAAEWTSWLTGTNSMFCRGVVSEGCRDRYVCIAKARGLLGFQPKISLGEGLRISCEVSDLVHIFIWGEERR
ncbi:C-3 sterol dehydrogenase/C-4 decarboxylase-like protein [Phaeosphaeriaceae sp. PMI808]|nr:C-3 sterol dehydrogenase/C-4 decarboxylase-like protein [Phaeosphaeriaceae sp. PMI808]